MIYKNKSYKRIMDNYLYQKIDLIREITGIEAIPKEIVENLNPELKIREYQKEAFENFIFYFNNNKLREKPTHVLFHMATGSGKTYIMAGLILYLYMKGYRNYIFFVNSNNIINKTINNFTKEMSKKYQFNFPINIEGKNVKINVVTDFTESRNDDINICFTTIQDLHLNLNKINESKMSYDDFEDKKIVLIADEAHHLNTISSNKKLTKNEENIEQSWETTVFNVLHLNSENVLLEFTATCDLENENIKNKYLNKIIYNYPLWKFRQDGYSKEIETLRSNVEIETRMLQAVLISQYRLKLFQKNGINVKPVILFKSKIIEESNNNKEKFNKLIQNLNVSDIENIKNINKENKLIIRMFKFFDENKIEYQNLIQEIKEDFAKDYSISVNEEDAKKQEENEKLVNTLEDKDNKIRTIFAVNKLNEGWDVLNLFDIVRLYETRDASKNKPGKTTIEEAQLIGRGARYYPFSLNENDNMYVRKFDSDIENELRLCETLIYHCQNEPKYISELKKALQETGLYLSEDSKKVTYKLKDSFKKTKFYKEGLIFYNTPILIDRTLVKLIDEEIKNKIYEFNFCKSSSKSDIVFENENLTQNSENNGKVYETQIKIKEIANINYNIVLTAIRKFPIYQFDILKKYYPNIKSTREFIMSDDYLGNIQLIIKTSQDVPTLIDYYNAVFSILDKIKDDVIKLDKEYIGSNHFLSKKVNEIFHDKTKILLKIENDGEGISQKDVEDESFRLDLSDKDWYIYEDNYGTTEEKKFLKYFNDFYNINKLNKKYSEVYLIRNERELALYTFNDGERFEPDFLLILIDNKDKKESKQYQIFIEPKGNHLLEYDLPKEEFLKEIQDKSIPVKEFASNVEYFIEGLPFFNKDNKLKEFDESLKQIINL